jgi:hypothetical protein
MLLPVPYNFPGVVKQITSHGNSTEVILSHNKNPSEDIPKNTLEITILLSGKTRELLSLKKKDAAYTTIFSHPGAIPPGSGEEMFTVRDLHKCWVTICRGPATKKQIENAIKQATIDHKPPPVEIQTMWSHGYLFPEQYRGKIEDVSSKQGGCESENNQYQIETILQPSPRNTWKTILFGTDCEAKILNQKEKYSHSTEHPVGDAIAWSHGYATHTTFMDAFDSAKLEVNGPTLAGFIYSGSDSRCELFTSSGMSPGYKTWAIPVNLYHNHEKIGTAKVVNIDVNPKVRK